MQHVGYWINQQQTLITGLLALAIGGATIYYLQRQIQQQQAIVDDQNKRRLRAVRAGLPLTLSEIHDYSRQCIDLLCHFLSKSGSWKGDTEYDYELEQETLKTLPLVPEFPVEAFKAIQVVIEHAELDDAQKLQEIIAYGQIQHSRFGGLTRRLIQKEDSSWVVTGENVMGAIRDAAGLMLHIERVYDYARETGPDIHDLGDANRASDTLLWMNKGGEPVRKYIREHWPPDFPHRIPSKGTEIKPAAAVGSD